MEQELERIFRLMALLLPKVRAARRVRRRAVRQPDGSRQRAGVPRQRPEAGAAPIAACRCSTARSPSRSASPSPISSSARRSRTPEQAVATLLASEDPWLRSCGAYAVGALQLHSLEPELQKLEQAADPALREDRSGGAPAALGRTETPQAPVAIGMESGIG